MTDAAGESRVPDRVAVVGGGRWARVVLDVLLERFPEIGQLTVHTRGNADGMRDWIAQRDDVDRIRVSERPGAYEDAGAIIVVNAARDHERSVESAIAAKIPVLVEKPFTLSGAAAERLVALARSSGVPLATAHVFLFASYVTAFVREVAAAGRLTSLRLLWTDPAGESRYGERKQYDAGLPIVADLLPHVISILYAVMPRADFTAEQVRVDRGGAHVEIDLLAADTRCSVQLARNAPARRRVLEVDTGSGLLRLDFSTEPGAIERDGVSVPVPSAWDTASRPLASMLGAFLGWVAGGQGTRGSIR